MILLGTIDTPSSKSVLEAVSCFDDEPAIQARIVLAEGLGRLASSLGER